MLDGARSQAVVAGPLELVPHPCTTRNTLPLKPQVVQCDTRVTVKSELVFGRWGDSRRDAVDLDSELGQVISSTLGERNDSRLGG